MPKHSRSKRNKVYTSFTNEPNMKSSKGAQNVGVCNICKKYGLLTFDHVPPISTRKIIQENSDFLKDKNFVLENCNKEGRFVQKLGFRTVCGKCNQIGGKYVNGFNRMIKHLLSHINEGMHKRTVSIKINL
ncbi:MAG: hypothetical protein OXU23_13320, partial [Candidatus Poribacteria bacterium]|nr:hypothetical protein [Candidatus Poribacteria bacterium]